MKYYKDSYDNDQYLINNVVVEFYADNIKLHTLQKDKTTVISLPHSQEIVVRLTNVPKMRFNRVVVKSDNQVIYDSRFLYLMFESEDNDTMVIRFITRIMKS